MDSNKNRYLTHLKNCIPKHANNYMLSTYSIILEAWRRGLEVNIRIVLEASGKIEPYFSLSDGKKTHQFSVTRGDLVSVEAKNLTKDKRKTKEYLIKNNVPTPKGTDFDETVSDAEITEYANELGYPVVIKPIKGTGGRGVIANIKNEQELVKALEYVRKKLNYPHIILEQYFEGNDYRIYVLDGKVIGALKRIRANVVGNGKDSIRTLIEKKNNERMKSPALSNRPIKIDSETRTLLEQSNYTLDTVLEDGEIFYLKTKNNVSAGGDSVDMTDQISNNIKQIAIEAVNSFPSLPHCGLDLILDEENDTAVVIELNSRAHITQHLFPMYGQARDIPSAIVDYYFPDTKDYNRDEANQLYIDYDFIYDACLSRTAREINLPKIPSSPIVLTRFLLTNCTYTDQFAKRVRRIAFNNHVSGYIKPLKNGNISIVVGGNRSKVQKFEKSLRTAAKKFFNNVEITEKTRKTPIKHGFHIEQPDEEEKGTVNTYLKKYSELKGEYQKLIRNLAEYEQQEKMIELTSKQNKNLKKQLRKMEESTSWKITKPIRKLGQLKKSK